MTQMKTIEELIRGHPFFRDLDAQSVSLIAGCGRNVLFKSGDYVMREGDSADEFFLLRSGRIALESFVPGRGPVVFQTIKDGDFLGVSWLVPPFRVGYDAHVLEDVRATGFDAKCLRNKCEADHDFGYELMKHFVPPLVERLNAARMQRLDVYAQSVGDGQP